MYIKDKWAIYSYIHNIYNINLITIAIRVKMLTTIIYCY